MKPYFFALWIALAPMASFAGGVPEFASDDTLKIAKDFQDHLRAGDRESIAEMIRYPLRQTAPLPDINSPEEFLQHWDEFFNDERVAQYLSAEPNEMGWRGVMLERGCVWFEGENLKSFNCHTDQFNQRLKAAKQKDSEQLYSSAQGYDHILESCQAEDFYVRIQDHGEDTRLFVWEDAADLSAEPLFEAHDGVWDAQGSGGNGAYRFEDGTKSYEYYSAQICEGGDCRDVFSISGDQSQDLERECEKTRVEVDID